MSNGAEATPLLVLSCADRQAIRNKMDGGMNKIKDQIFQPQVCIFACPHSWCEQQGRILQPHELWVPNQWERRLKPKPTIYFGFIYRIALIDKNETLSQIQLTGQNTPPELRSLTRTDLPRRTTSTNRLRSPQPPTDRAIQAPQI